MMFWRRSATSDEPAAAAAPAAPAALAVKPAKLLVIQSDKYDWVRIFRGATLADGRAVEVCQCGWDGLKVAAEPQSREPLICHVRRVVPDERGKLVPAQKLVTFTPDFVLVRNEVFSPRADYRNQLYGLMYGGVEGVNSLLSLTLFAERALIGAEMARLNRELGDAAFPTISQNYFAGFEEMMYTQAFPAVIKIGSAHAGMGKARVEDHHAMDDMRSLLAVSGGKYATCEPFVEARCDLRIQKIGARVRVFRRTGMSGDWKTNTGSAMIEEIAVAPRYRAWAEAAATMFGGTTREPLDILTVDALIDEAGREVILEVNGSSSGLAPDAEDEDNQHISELVLQKMSARLAERAATAVGAVAVKAAVAAAAATVAAAEATAARAEAAEVTEAAAAEATDTAAGGRTTAAVERDER